MADYISRDDAVCIADYAADEHPYSKDSARPETYSDYNRGWNDACDYIREKLEAEKPADVEPVRQRWIPCSERLPEKEGWYLVTSYSQVQKKNRTTMKPFCEGAFRSFCEVSHWMPLRECICFDPDDEDGLCCARIEAMLCPGENDYCSHGQRKDQSADVRKMEDIPDAAKEKT